MLANPTGKTPQQAERAKFWAQFQETWQQVRPAGRLRQQEPRQLERFSSWQACSTASTVATLLLAIMRHTDGQRADCLHAVACAACLDICVMVGFCAGAPDPER